MTKEQNMETYIFIKQDVIGPTAKYELGLMEAANPENTKYFRISKSLANKLRESGFVYGD